MADFQERCAKAAVDDEVNRKGWDTCPDNWKTDVDENGKRIHRPAFRALLKKLAAGTFPGIDPAAAQQVLQPSKVPKSEGQAWKQEGVMEGQPSMAVVAQRPTQLPQPTARLPSMVPAISNSSRPSTASALRATSSSFVPRNPASSAINNTRHAQTGMSMAVVQQQPMTENIRPVQMATAAPSLPTIRFDATIEDYERWGAENFKG